MRRSPSPSHLPVWLLPGEVRTLDAIHLAAVLELGADLARLVAHDERLRAAAQAVRCPVAAPFLSRHLALRRSYPDAERRGEARPAVPATAIPSRFAARRTFSSKEAISASAERAVARQ